MKQPINPYTISLILILTSLTLGFQCMKPPPEEKVHEDRPMMAEIIVLDIPLGLDPELQYIPEDNPLTAEKIELGKMLYFENVYLPIIPFHVLHATTRSLVLLMVCQCLLVSTDKKEAGVRLQL